MLKVNLKKLDSLSKETEDIKNSVDISDLKDATIKTEAPVDEWTQQQNGGDWGQGMEEAATATPV